MAFLSFYSLTCLPHKVIFPFSLKKDINGFRHLFKLFTFNCVIFKISCGSCGDCYPQIIKLMWFFVVVVPIVKSYTNLDLFLEYLCQPLVLAHHSTISAAFNTNSNIFRLRHPLLLMKQGMNDLTQKGSAWKGLGSKDEAVSTYEPLMRQPCETPHSFSPRST